MDRFALVALLALSSTACAVGNTYDYRHAAIALPVTGEVEVGAAVVDARPYVRSGDKSPDFVGFQRGGYGNPFDVTTTSGEPLAKDMQSALIQALSTRGFAVAALELDSVAPAAFASVVRENGLRRNVLLILNEWKTDAFARFGLSYDIALRVVDENYALLAEAKARGDKEVIGGAGFESQNDVSARNAFEIKVARLFNDPEVRAALGGD